MDFSSAKNDLLITQSQKCKHFFIKNNCQLELGYYYLLNQDFKNAKKCFEKILEIDIRAHWANFLINLIEGKITYYPSYFELRNFFEIDLDLLMKNFLGNYVQTLVNYSDFLSQFNSEINKYIARVFLINNYKSYALLYFNRAKDSFYNDPELHFLIAQTNFKDGNIEQAKKSADRCLEILPEYWPAVKLLETIENSYTA